jgi:hypothetical protein
MSCDVDLFRGVCALPSRKRKRPDMGAVFGPPQKKRWMDSEPATDADNAPDRAPAAPPNAPDGQPIGPQRVCSSCHRPGHLRRTHKTCEFYTPKPGNVIPEHMQGQQMQTANTPIGLDHIICRALNRRQKRRLKETINDIVARMTVICNEATRAFHGYVLFMLENGRAFPRLNCEENGIMREFFAGVVCHRNNAGREYPRQRTHRTKDPTLLEYFRNHYRNQRPDDVPWTSGFLLGDHITFAAQMHETNCLNHICTLLPLKLEQWIAYQLKTRLTTDGIALGNETLESLSR